MAQSIYSRYYGMNSLEVDGKITLVQRISPPIVEYPDSLVHIMQGNETLDQLAKLYYQNSELWWRIADANPHIFPLDLKAGDEVFIPPLRVATRTSRS